MAEENLPPEPSDEELEDMLEEDTPESPPENTGEPVNQPLPEPEAQDEETQEPTEGAFFRSHSDPTKKPKGPGLSIPGSERTVIKTPDISLENVEPPKSMAEEMPLPEDLLSLPEGSMGESGGTASEEEVGRSGPSPDDLVHARAASRRASRHRRMGIADAGPATFPENMEPPSIEGGMGGVASSTAGGGGGEGGQLTEAVKQLQTSTDQMVDILAQILERQTVISEGITKLSDEQGAAYV